MAFASNDLISNGDEERITVDDDLDDDDSSCDDDYFDMNEDVAPANAGDLFGGTLSHLME